jgi:hypothetical protein
VSLEHALYFGYMSIETTFDDVIAALPDPARRRHELEELLAMSRAGGSEESSPVGPWQVVSGTRILLSAPHEVAHFRDGDEKIAEQGTGPLAMALARYVGGCAISTMSNQTGDPNWDINHPYIKRAASIAESCPAVDIHMMRPRGPDICIGLGPFPDLAQELWPPIVEEAISAGIRASLNWPFAGNPRTVTGQLQARGRRAIQLELSWECFDPTHPAMASAWSALARAVRRLSGG